MSQKNHARKRQIKKLGEHYVSDLETWNLFEYHAKYILAGLRKFYHAKRWGAGPNELLEKAYKKRNLDLYGSHKKHKEAMNEAEAEATAEWNSILCEMIWTFDQIARDFPDEPFFVWQREETAKLEAQDKPSFDITKKDDLGTYYQSNLPMLPESVKADDKTYQKRIHDGLHLYAEYFLNLWD